MPLRRRKALARSDGALLLSQQLWRCSQHCCLWDGAGGADSVLLFLCEVCTHSPGAVFTCPSQPKLKLGGESGSESPALLSLGLRKGQTQACAHSVHHSSCPFAGTRGHGCCVGLWATLPVPEAAPC